MSLRKSGWLILGITGFLAAQNSSDEASSTSRRLEVLEQALSSRDQEIVLLEDEIASWKVKYEAALAETGRARGELKQAGKLLEFEKSLTSFQEKQIENFRGVVREQRKQINTLNTLLTETAEP